MNSRKSKGSDTYEQNESLHRGRAGAGRIIQRHRAAASATTAAASTEHEFFVAGAGPGKGADLGGLRGREHCQTLAARTARRQDLARLSQHAAGRRQAAVNARDRIGNGPWQNHKGTVVAANLDELHSDNNKLGYDNSLSERGLIIPGVGFAPNRHDVLTGSTAEGRAFPAGDDRTCRNWSSSTQGAAMVGHIDKKGLRDDPPSKSWNSSHPSRGPEGGCSQSDLRGTGGDGLFYCFASN